MSPFGSRYPGSRDRRLTNKIAARDLEHLRRDARRLFRGARLNLGPDFSAWIFRMQGSQFP